MKRESMELICYKYEGWQPKIRPATPKRAWMDATNERYAYRCLPLAIANSHGWELLSPCAFEAKWDGGIHMDCVEVRADPGTPDRLKPVTLFGYGTLTVHIEGIFRTPPGWNLYVTGPPNSQKDAIQALSGIIETDWAPYTFTMNWRFTRADQWVRFEENEPIAFFFPVERGRVQQFDPRIEPLEEQGELLRQFEKWSKSRTDFQKWIVTATTASPSERWQKLYYRGLDADGRPGTDDHQSKLRVPGFRFRDGSVMDPPEARACPMRSWAPPPAPLTAKAPDNVLLAGQGRGPGFGGLMSNNPALALTLERIGFDGAPARAAPRVEAPVREEVVAAGAELALRQRDWLLEAQARQRLLSARAGAVERVRAPSGADFLDLYYAPGRPAVIEGALDDWPILTRWTPERLVAAQADERIAMADDLGRLDAYLSSAAGTVTFEAPGDFIALRFAAENQLVVQLVGARQIILLPPSATGRLYAADGLTSAVEDIMDEERLARFPLAGGAETHEIVLAAGEILYLPVGWWWQATALDDGAAVAYADFRWPNAGHAAFPTA